MLMALWSKTVRIGDATVASGAGLSTSIASEAAPITTQLSEESRRTNVVVGKSKAVPGFAAVSISISPEREEWLLLEDEIDNAKTKSRRRLGGF